MKGKEKKDKNPRPKVDRDELICMLVQGEAAADSVAEGIRLANRLGKADTIIVGRGGGSIEDLWAFNEEKVARAIFASQIPVISAVGHETDFTIADFVADLRASTPSNAAELAVNDINEDRKRAEALLIRLERNAESIMRLKQEKYGRLVESRAFRQPYIQLDKRKEYVNSLIGIIRKNAENTVKHEEAVLKGALSTLEALSPLKVLSRGYSYTENELGRAVTSAADVNEGDRLSVTFMDGRVSVTAAEKVMFDGKEN